MCRVLTVKIFCLKKKLTCLNAWMLLNQFMKVQYNLPIKNLLGQNPTVLFIVGKIEEKLPRHIITTWQVRALESAENDM